MQPFMLYDRVFQTVDYKPLVGLEIDLVGGIQHFFNERDKNRNYHNAYHVA